MSRQNIPLTYLCQFFELVESSGDSQWNVIDIGYAIVNKQTAEFQFIQKETSNQIHVHEIQAESKYITIGSFISNILYYVSNITPYDAIQFNFGSKLYAMSFQTRAGVQLIQSSRSVKGETQINRNTHATEEGSKEIGRIKFLNRSTWVRTYHRIKYSKIIQNTLSLKKIIQINFKNLIAKGNIYRTQISNMFVNNKDIFINKLHILFDQAENSQGENPQLTLKFICNIVKQIFLIAEHELLQILLSDNHFQFVFGALEYDEEMLKKDFIPHRKFFTNYSCFVPIVEFRDKNKTNLLHFTYRLQYLKDCALAYFLDETQMIFMRIIIKNCYCELLKYIENSKDFLSQAVDQLRQNNLNALKFIHEICSVLREYADVLNRVGIYEKLNEYNLYEILEELLKDFEKGTLQQITKTKKKTKYREDILPKVPQLCLEIMIMSAQHQPNYLRTYLTSATAKILKFPFLNKIFDNLIGCQDSVLQVLYSELVQYLIDSNETDTNEVQEQFLSNFQRFLQAFSLEKEPSETFRQYQETFIEICTDLAQCYQKPRVREIFSQTNLLEVCGNILAKQKDKFMCLKVLQLMRSLLITKDDEMIEDVKKLLPGFVKVFINYRRTQENMMFAVMLLTVKVIYFVGQVKLQDALEFEISQYVKHSSFSRILQIVNDMKDASMQNLQLQPQSSLFSESKLKESLKNNQTHETHRGEYDDIDLFSPSGMQLELERRSPLQKKLVDYDDDEIFDDKIEKKIKS